MRVPVLGLAFTFLDLLLSIPCLCKLSQPQSITENGVHTDLLTAWEREHWFLQHFQPFLAAGLGPQ